jgi:hypothetical protein
MQTSCTNCTGLYTGGRPQRTVKAPQVFTFTSPNNNDSSSPSKPSAKKKRKKRKKPSERSAQENLEAMRESRARNLPPSSDGMSRRRMILGRCQHIVPALGSCMATTILLHMVTNTNNHSLHHNTLMAMGILGMDTKQ